jgi:hypothetical protein
MNMDELDRILSSETEIIPSSRFISSVMNSVRSEAAEPPPIPFPWKWAMPGIVAWIVALIWTVLGSLSQPARQAEPLLSNLASRVIETVETAQMFGVWWISLALLLTYFSAKLADYAVGRRA